MKFFPPLLVTMLLSQNFAVGQPALPNAEARNQAQALVDRAARQALDRFASQQLKPDEFALTFVDLRNPEQPVSASYRGDVPIYPASVVKLFYLAAAHHWMEAGRLADTPELQRAMRDMIVESYNEATHYVVDVLTGTTSGPELSEAELEAWRDKRDAVNRHFASLGYTGINVNKKPWCEGPYGREVQAMKAFKPNRNMLTTEATAQLMTRIATGRAVSAARSAQMMELMKRNPFGTGDKEPDSQSKFTGPALPPGSKLWSKAGWTSETRHDAACVELPNGARFVLVVFTVGHANQREIIPAIAGEFVKALN